MIFILFKGKSEEKRGKFMKCFMGKEEKLELRQKIYMMEEKYDVVCRK